MNEACAREVLLLQAFETAVPASPSWSDDDRAWATRVTLHDQSVGGDNFIVRRAHHAMQRLAPREPALTKWLARGLWSGRWVVAAILFGVVAGAVVDSIGSSQRINLLAPPVWAVVAWNLVVYMLLIMEGATGLARPAIGAPVGGRRRAVQRMLRGIGSLRPPPAAGGSAAAWRSFAALWMRHGAPLALSRGAVVLHAAAAALALGLLAGMYARGLVLDYRAAWESTFLSAEVVHAVLNPLLAPAASLSGIVLPDVAGFEALRVAHGSIGGVGGAGGSAAPWIHLYALTLLLAVVLPRSVLALWSALRAWRLARAFPLPLDGAYFAALAREQRGDVARVEVIPYAQTPEPQAVLGLRALLAASLTSGRDAGLQVQVRPTLAFGAEDDAAAWADVPASTTVAMALFDMSATPEAENQGAFVRQLAQRAPAGTATVVLVDEASFVRRFGGDAVRIEQRRDAWRRLLEPIGSVPVFADLQGTAPSIAAQRALQAVLAAPVRSERT